MKVDELEQAFDEGREVLSHFDQSRLQKPNAGTKKPTMDFPVWLLKRIDREAKRIGVSSQALIKVWCVEKLKSF